MPVLSKKKNDEFSLIWSLLPHPSRKHVVRSFSRLGETRDGDHCRTVEELRKFARIKRDHNVYIAPNPTLSTTGIRHSAKDVTHWSYFLLDMDPVESNPDPEAAMQEALALLSKHCGRDLIKHQPLLIDSGRGMQAWIRLDHEELDDESRLVARCTNGWWLKKLDEELGVTNGCRLDTSVSDLPRVMRCPGTINQKSGRLSRVVVPSRIVYYGLSGELKRQVPDTSLVTAHVVNIVPGQRWQKVWPYLTRSAQTYVTEGQCEPGRHKVMWHTIQKFHELGVTRGEAQRAVRRANTLKGKQEELRDQEIEDRLKYVYDSA